MDLIKHLGDIVKSCETVQFCTFALDEYPETRTIMNKLNDKASDLNELHFMTSNKSNKYKQVLKNPHVCLYYYNPTTRMAVTFFGIASIIDNSGHEKFWRPEFVAFGYSGPDDERLAVMKFIPKSYKFFIDGIESSGKI